MKDHDYIKGQDGIIVWRVRGMEYRLCPQEAGWALEYRRSPEWVFVAQYDEWGSLVRALNDVSVMEGTTEVLEMTEASDGVALRCYERVLSRSEDDVWTVEEVLDDFDAECGYLPVTLVKTQTWDEAVEAFLN